MLPETAAWLGGNVLFKFEKVVALYVGLGAYPSPTRCSERSRIATLTGVLISTSLVVLYLLDILDVAPPLRGE